MYLDVPLIRQQSGTKDCGAACMAMVLAYQDQPIPIGEVKKYTGTSRIGLTASRLGSAFLKYGFDATMVTKNPDLFRSSEETLSNATLLHRIQDSEDRYSVLSRKQYANFIKKGGVVQATVPYLDTVVAALHDGSPLIALTTTNYHTAYRPRLNMHFQVITGLIGDEICLNDPFPDQYGGRIRTPARDFFYTLHVATGKGIDTGSLLIAQPRNTT